MNILILGSSSAIGTAVAMQFARGNALFLSGRDLGALQNVQKMAHANGAERTHVILGDLVSGHQYILSELQSSPIDILINAASSTSRLYDSQAEPTQLQNYLYTDLITPIQLIEKLVQQQRHLQVIFISTVLARLNNSDRQIYSSLKALQKIFLSRLESDYPALKVHTFYIGKRLSHKECTPQVKQMAKKIRAAYLDGKKNALCGFSGYILLGMSKIHPIINNGMVFMARLLRKGSRRGG